MVSPPHEMAAVADGVGKTYASGPAALDSVSLGIESGSVTALVGSNGAGKSTLLKVLAGLLAPSAGKVRVFGVPAATRSLRARIGYVEQSVALDPELTGRETLALFAALYGLSPRRATERISELGSTFGLGAWLGRRVGRYSGGLRQRLHLALGVVHQPELWLFDEPAAALDPAGRADLWKLVGQQGERKGTVVVVTHDLADVSAHARNVVILERGRVVATGTPAELCAAHAKFGLELRLNGGPRETSNLTTRSAELESLAGGRKLHVDGARVFLELEAASSETAQREKDRTLAEFAGLGLAITAYELREPDLYGAYFRLTGKSLGGELIVTYGARVLGAICLRTWIKTARFPVALSFSFVQPVVWLVFFGFLFRRYEVGEFSRQARYLDFLLPGVSGMTVLFGASQSGVGLIRDIQTGFLNRLLASPANPMLVLGGKLVADVTRLLLQGLIVLALGVALGANVTLSASAVLACLAVLALLGTALACVSCVVAMTARAQESMGAFVQLVNMPLLFTSSALVPVRHMPDWLAPVGRVNPMTLAVDACREALLVGTFGRLPSALGWLGLAALAGLALAYATAQKLIRET